MPQAPMTSSAGPRKMDRIEFDGVLIVGAGLAGLSAALIAAPRRTLALSPTPLGRAAPRAWAQGGMAVAMARRTTAQRSTPKTPSTAGAGLWSIPKLCSVLTDGGTQTRCAACWPASARPSTVTRRRRLRPRAWRPPTPSPRVARVEAAIGAGVEPSWRAVDRGRARRAVGRGVGPTPALWRLLH